jgi:UPF0176 protein
MITNISGYRFVRLDNLNHWQSIGQQQCLDLDLKGTVVWSQEGINIMLAGSEPNIQAWIEWLHTFPEFAGLTFKWSHSATIPFKRTMNKIKAVLVPGQVDPLLHPAPAIAPKQLREWYANGKDFVIIDTRNDYELEAGKFKNALDIQLHEFKEFPEKIAALPEAIKNKPVVLYCTGGIRCEKAAPLAEQAGFKEVYQLEGGILEYFKDCGQDFYEGDCFVFDERRTLSADE